MSLRDLAQGTAPARTRRWAVCTAVLPLALAGCPNKKSSGDEQAPQPAEREAPGGDTDTGAGEGGDRPDASAADRRPDPHSFSRPDHVAVERMGFDWHVDMDRRVLSGNVILKIARTDDGANEPLILDTRGLDIGKVGYRTDLAPEDRPLYTLTDAGDGWTETKFALGEPDEIRGRKMSIQIPDEATLVRIGYATTADSTGLQWLEPAQTQGGKHPFLYSQSQAIHARSWFPAQDSPGVRVTYDARVQVPKELVAVMSAAQGKPSKAVPPADTNTATFTFEMERPIPAYLIALGVGDLAFKEVGPNTGVWADPAIVAGAANELAEMEKMIDAAEALYGPYRWGRYDVLILPPAFPFGGMENPRLTFATPTILAGDGSLLSLIAHELAHSWSGNLVTNATWSDLWLNEGFTVYAERRMVESLYGEERLAMEAMLGRQDLEEDLESGIEELDLRRLRPDLADRDPDDNFSDVPYEKGALLLFALEKAYGREIFDPFIRSWFDEHAFSSVTTSEFVAFTRANLLDEPSQHGKAPDLDTWIRGTDLPPTAPTWETEAFAVVDAEVDAFLAGESQAQDVSWKGWDTHQRLHFLRAITESVTLEQMTSLDAAFELTKSNNAELAAQWFVIAGSKGYAPADGAIEAFLKKVGRRKFLVPIYRALASRDEGKARAKAIYTEARSGYHSISQSTLDDLLGHEDG